MSRPFPDGARPSPSAAVSPTAFAALGLSPAITAALARLAYAQPTPIQTAAIPLALAGHDVLACAQTGTGKTAAFGLPTIERLRARPAPAGDRRPRGLVLVPTRELAVQVHRALLRYGAPLQIRSTVVFGGVSMAMQIQALRQAPHVVVATPGRLLDHVERRTIDLSAIEILTLDEADRMLDIGFLPALRRLLALVPRRRQTLLFSATLPAAVLDLAAEMTHEARRLDVSGHDVVPVTVSHHVHPVADDRKGDLLAHVLAQAPAGQALVFCRTKHRSDRVGRHLDRLGIATAVIHGNKSQNARTRALDGFRAGRVRVLVATDIAARGLDIVELPLVVNYDLPLVAEDYVHRVGRTGRAQASGRAVSLVSAAERPLLRAIQRTLPAPIDSVAVAGFEAGGAHEAEAPLPRRGPAPHGRHGARRRDQGGRSEGDAAGRPQDRRWPRGPRRPGVRRGPRTAASR